MFIKQYTLTRIILQRHKSFLLPSNFSPRVVQQLRHPPIMILLLQRIIRMLPHRIILRRYQPRLLLPLLQTIRRRRHANGGKHVMVTRLLSGMPMRRNMRVIWWWVERCASKQPSIEKQFFTEDFFDITLMNWSRGVVMNTTITIWMESINRTMWYHWGRRRWTREEYCNEQLICLYLPCSFCLFFAKRGSLLGGDFDSSNWRKRMSSVPKMITLTICTIQ